MGFDTRLRRLLTRRVRHTSAEGRRHPLSLGDRRPGAVWDTRCATNPQAPGYRAGVGWVESGGVKRNQRAAERQRGAALIHRAQGRRRLLKSRRIDPHPTPAQRDQPGASIHDPVGFDTPPPAATHPAEGGRSGGYSPRRRGAPGGYSPRGVGCPLTRGGAGAQGRQPFARRAVVLVRLTDR